MSPEENYGKALAFADEQFNEMFGTDPARTAQMDQLLAGLKVYIAKMGADLDDPVQARAAFAGAWSVCQFLLGLSMPAEVIGNIVAELACYPRLAAIGV